VELLLKVLWSLDIVEAERVRRRVSRLDRGVRVTFRTLPGVKCSTDSSDSLMRLNEAGDRATVKRCNRIVREGIQSIISVVMWMRTKPTRDTHNEGEDWTTKI
jgi:hypothetical protein